MKKIITKHLCIYMLLGLIITVMTIFTIQSFVAQGVNTQKSVDKLAAVSEKLAGNDEQIKQLTDSISENNLAKTRAFAEIINLDKTIINSNTRMEELRKKLDVNELYVVDEKGIVTHSTEPFVGFDLSKGEQSKPFMAIVDDPSVEIAQEPQINSTQGILMQYIGVARLDDKGFVQIGIRPEVLEELLKGTRLDIVLNEFDFGETGYVFAVDANTGKILSHPDTGLIGTSAKDAGLPTFKNEKGKGKVNGISGFYVTQEYGDKIIGTFMPEKEYFKDRMIQTLMVSGSMLIIFVILLLAINHMVGRKIVRGINSICHSMKQIADGDFSVKVEEKSSPEFILLSNSINIMVDGIVENINKNKELLEGQKNTMESNMALIDSVKTTCVSLGDASQKTLLNAQEINNGTEQQKQAVDDLKQIMDKLVNELNVNAEASRTAATSTVDAAKKVFETKSQMEALEESIKKISTMSDKISKIIGEITSIAQQTNMLSINASIEAARAGAAGKGFSVVALQVGELAQRTAQAAQETGDLISNSIQAVDEGEKITKQTVDEFEDLVREIEDASKQVSEITNIVVENVNSVSEIAVGIDKISNVVENNVMISRNAQQVSENMAGEAGKLMQLVDQN